jgi:acyl-CoA synthetase (AMP-forming)/AMP-acid ligase II
MLHADTLGDLLRTAARTAPTTDAFRYRDERLTYADWDALADRVASGLAARGVQAGDVVALLLPSTPLYLIAYLGAARLGAVTTGINIRYRRVEIGHILERAAPRWILAVDAWHDTDFHPILDPLVAERAGATGIDWFGADDVRAGSVALVGQFAGDAPRITATVDPTQAAAIVFTSGTTGVPKGAWYSHANLIALAAIDTRRYASGTPPFQKHFMAGLSFAHIGTMARIALQLGHLGTSIIQDTFDPATVLATIEQERLPHLGGIPTQIIMLLDHPNRPQRDLSSLRTVLLGGAPAAPELIRRIQRELGVSVSVRYSSTEVGIGTASLEDDPPEILATTVGKPTPGVELRLVDEHEQPVARGEVGRVHMRSAATMRGYWRDPEQTASAMTADGWIRTGDLGWLDDAGYLHLRGRESEMFIRGGFNVYPAEIEDVLARHPKVGRAAVLGIPDPTFGEIGWAVVVPRQANDPPTLPELRVHIGAELASFKRPDGLTVVRELPITPMFKVDKRALRELLEAER